MRILGFLLVGLTVGGISGLCGIGGGVLLVPILVWLFGFDQPKAAGTTLATLVLPVALPAAWRYYSYRLMDLEAAVCIAVAFAVGGYVSAGFAHHVPERVLRQAFGLLMLYIGARFLLSASSTRIASARFGMSGTRTNRTFEGRWVNTIVFSKPNLRASIMSKRLSSASILKTDHCFTK